jgi:hypothetical protein
MHISRKNKSGKNLGSSYYFSSQMNWILKPAKTFTQNAFRIEKTYPFCLGQLPNFEDVQFNKKKINKGREHIVGRISRHRIMWKFNPRNLISPIGNTRRLLHWFEWRRKNTSLHLIKGILTSNSKQILMFSWWKKYPLHVKNEPTYKKNWGTLSGNFKNIFNYMISIGHIKNILIHDSSR